MVGRQQARILPAGVAVEEFEQLLGVFGVAEVFPHVPLVRTQRCGDCWLVASEGVAADEEH
jgi:hypothetical protein